MSSSPIASLLSTPSSSFTPRSKALSTPSYSMSRSPEIQFDSPHTPLHTKEEQVEIKSRREKLDLEIKSLEQRKKNLEKERSNARKESVSKGEVKLLQRSIYDDVSNEYSRNLVELSNVYSDLVATTRKMTNEITVLEEKVAQEVATRTFLMSRNADMAKHMEECVPPVSVTALKQTEAMKGEKAPTSEGDMQRVIALRGELMTLVNSKPSSTIQIEGAQLYSKACELEWRHRGLGRDVIFKISRTLQNELSEALMKIKRTEGDVSKYREEYTRLCCDIDHEDILKTADFDAEIEQIENKIQQARDKLKSSVTLTVGGDRTDEYPQNNKEAEELIRFRDTLKEELVEASQKYRDLKKMIFAREKKIQREIQSLYESYVECKAAIITSPRSLKSACQSPVSKELTRLISRIDQSIHDFEDSFD